MAPPPFNVAPPMVVALEAEEEGEPVQEVHVRGPSVVRRLPEVADGSERGGNGSDLWESERWGLREEGGMAGLGRVWLGFGLGDVRCRW